MHAKISLELACIFPTISLKWHVIENKFAANLVRPEFCQIDGQETRVL